MEAQHSHPAHGVKETKFMTNSHSDALVFFGATGDLAYKKIFPSLQAMVKRGHLSTRCGRESREICYGGKRRGSCLIGYQARRSRSVKTATNGCRHPDTYTNRKRQRTPNKY